MVARELEVREGLKMEILHRRSLSRGMAEIYIIKKDQGYWG